MQSDFQVVVFFSLEAGLLEGLVCANGSGVDELMQVPRAQLTSTAGMGQLGRRGPRVVGTIQQRTTSQRPLDRIGVG
jgi:hypothetical protein